ncbi:MAG: DNA-formamidopyrimidine glycosylase [Prochlorotrichaceae cyanobacterium]
MPELPEVETVCRGLNRTTCNQVVTGGEVLLPRTIAYPQESDAFIRGLAGVQIEGWRRRGKYLLADLTRQDAPAGWLAVHLRMTGQLLWVTETTAVDRHTRLRIKFGSSDITGDDRELRFVDVRTFGQVWWIPPDRSPEEIITTLKTLGPEPLSPDFSAPYLQERLGKTQRSLKTVLLDQSIIAGLGNIYADECLFLSGLHPEKPAPALTPAEIQRLVEAIVSVLEAGIAAGGTTLRDYRTVEGTNGNYGGQAWVYRRTGQPCRRCSTPIQRIKLAGRSTHFCPHCQPATP